MRQDTSISKKHIELVSRVNKHIKSELRKANASDKSLVSKFAKMHKLAAKRRKTLVEELSAKAGVNLKPFLEHHKKDLAMRRKWISEEQQRFTSIARERQSIRRRMRAAVASLDSYYNRKSANSTLHVCLPVTIGNDAEGFCVGLTEQVELSFASTAPFRNKMNLRVRHEGSGFAGRDDWVSFVWDGPDSPGVADCYAYVDLSGTVSASTSSGGCLESTTAGLRFELWMLVAQEGNQGLTYFPTKKLTMIPYRQLGEDDSFYKQFTGEETIDYHKTIPIIAEKPVVFSVGIHWDVLLLSGDDSNSDFDFHRDYRDLNFPMVYVQFMS